jgi:3-hydroxyisobutyrate dehydrogenase
MAITILGTGLLGSGFARAFLRKGESIRVWNRTIARAQPLAADGATVIADAAEAVRGVERVHLVLSDDAAVTSVLDAAAPGFVPGTLVFDHSTTSPGGAIERTKAWRAKGIVYLHAPVFMGPGNALEGTGFMLVSGEREIVARVSPLLAPMTGKLLDLGERVDQAAAFKLIGNLLLFGLGAAFQDIVALAASMGIGAKEAGTLFDAFNPGAQLVTRYKRFTDALYDEPSWDLAMARKDAGLMLAEAQRAGIELRMLPNLAAKMDEMIGRGDAERDWTVVGKDLVKPDPS